MKEKQGLEKAWQLKNQDNLQTEGSESRKPILSNQESHWARRQFKTRTSSHYEYQKKASKLFATRHTTAFSTDS